MKSTQEYLHNNLTANQFLVIRDFVKLCIDAMNNTIILCSHSVGNLPRTPILVLLWVE